jgi:DNA-binding transcriptional regulator YiaG
VTSLTKKERQAKLQAEREERRRRSQEEKEKTFRQYVFDMVDEFADSAKELKKFSDYKDDDYFELRLKYAVFLVIPEAQEVKKKDFAEHYNLNVATLSEWRLRDDVVSMRDYFLKAYFKSKTPAVIHNLFKGASEP